MNQIIPWTRANARIFPYVQILVTVVALSELIFRPLSWWWLLSIFVYFLTGCLGITVTFHRYLTHRSFQMPRWMERLFSIFGALGGTGSPIGWVAVHNQHHRYSDTERDPHSPHYRGIKVLMSGYEVEFNKWSVRKMIFDPFHLILHNYYHLILLAWALFLALCGRNFLVYGFLIPVAIQLWASNLSNWGNHWMGYRNFETHEGSTNHWFLALITWGEGWHNNHHRYPRRWNFQIQPWEFDFSAWVIRGLRFMGAK